MGQQGAKKGGYDDKGQFDNKIKKDHLKKVGETENRQSLDKSKDEEEEEEEQTTSRFGVTKSLEDDESLDDDLGQS